MTKLYAKNENGRAHSFIQRERIKIKNINVPISRLSDADLAKLAGYYPVDEIELQAGERLANISYTFADNRWQQHGGVIDAATVEAQRQADLEAAEANRIAAKSTELKQAENAFLAAVQSANASLFLDIQPTDGFQDVMQKIKDSNMGEKIDRFGVALELRTLWDVVLFHGGKWGDVQYHDLEDE